MKTKTTNENLVNNSNQPQTEVKKVNVDMRNLILSIMCLVKKYESDVHLERTRRGREMSVTNGRKKGTNKIL